MSNRSITGYHLHSYLSAFFTSAGVPNGEFPEILITKCRSRFYCTWFFLLGGYRAGGKGVCGLIYCNNFNEKKFNSDGQEFHQYCVLHQQSEQPPVTSNHWTLKRQHLLLEIQILDSQYRNLCTWNLSLTCSSVNCITVLVEIDCPYFQSREIFRNLLSTDTMYLCKKVTECT